MVDPTRKKDRGPLRPEQRLTKPAANFKDPLLINTAHPKRPGTLDMHEFAKGPIGKIRLTFQWGGTFKGRPQLAMELAPYFRVKLATSSKSTTKSIAVALRSWWRFLDATEEFAIVESVKDLSEMHAALAIREGMPAQYLSLVLPAINFAREKFGLPELHFYAPTEPTKHKDLPDKRDIAAIYQELKKRVRDCFARFEAADSMAARGKIVSSDSSTSDFRKEEDIHATYRAHISPEGNPAPMNAPGLHLSNHEGTPFLQQLSRPVLGLYPCKEDVQAGLLLFLVKTGWNAQTAIDIDITGSWLRAHPTSSDHHLVASVKGRGNTEQIAVGLEKSELSPRNILQAFIDRTKPLRRRIQQQLKVAEEELRVRPSEEQTMKVTELRRKLASPWLYVTCQRLNAIYALDLEQYKNGNQQYILKAWIKERNARHRLSAGEGQVFRPIPESITIPQFRDAFISFSYESSGFSWLVTKIAAGHASLESLKSYLRKRRWKAHGERQVSRVQEALWDEIRHRRILEPAILRGLVERGVVTEEQRQRWSAHKDRTRMGTGCRDFYKPPAQISPEHIEGTGCRVQRCTLCPHAIIFEDSLDHLARRFVELETIQSQIPMKTWLESNFPDEIEATQAALKLFQSSEVDKFLEHWRNEINNERHIIFQFEGSYA